MAKTAKHVWITRDDIVIDGESFPWDITKNITVGVEGGGIHELTLTLIVTGDIEIEGVDG